MKTASAGAMSRQLEEALTWIETTSSGTFAAEAPLTDHMDLMELSKEQACPVWLSCINSL